MALEGNNGNTRELYEEFRKKLQSGDEADIFYDEDDLVEIYDQASDMEDEYVKLQVLLAAYRLYPKSEAMAARRGYFFWSYHMDEGVTRLLDTHSDSNQLIWKVLALRACKPAPEEVGPRLEALLNDHSDIDDETMIQLVDFASEAGAFEWLKANESLLRSKTTYLPTLLYELQIVAIIHGDRQYAIQKLEELTDVEPFVADYWNILSEEQMNQGNVEAAISAADYALAIDSENSEAIIARCRAMACSEVNDPDEILRLLTPLLTKDSTDSRALKIAVAAMLQTGKEKKALEALTEFNARCPWDRSVIDYLLVLRHPNISEILERHYEAMADDSTAPDYWVKWGEEKFTEKKYKEAAMIFGCCSRHEELSDESLSMYVTALYATGFYKAAASMLLNVTEELDTDLPRLNPDMALTGILSLLHLGVDDKALELAKVILDSPWLYSPGPKEVLAMKGLRESLQQIVKVMESKREKNMDYLLPDPYADLHDPEIDY